MRYIKAFESYNHREVLVIIDVQKSFSKFFTKNYLKQLNSYCEKFKGVYQVWDNHIDGKNVDKDYLYDDNPDVPIHDDLYHFPKQVDLIEKRYNYDVDVDFYKKVLDDVTYDEIKVKEDSKSLKRGDVFMTKEDTLLVYIGNNHIWYHLPKKLYDLFVSLKGMEIVMVGGSDQECFLDIETSAKALGVKVIRNKKFIYSATHCPIK